MPNGQQKDWSQLSWAEWKGEIGAQVNAIEKNQDELFRVLGKLREEVAYLKGKAAAWGAIAGSVAGGLIALINFLTGKAG